MYVYYEGYKVRKIKTKVDQRPGYIAFRVGNCYISARDLGDNKWWILIRGICHKRVFLIEKYETLMLDMDDLKSHMFLKATSYRNFKSDIRKYVKKKKL